MFKSNVSLFFIIVIAISVLQCSKLDDRSNIKKIPLQQVLESSYSPPFYGMSNIFFNKPSSNKFNFHSQWSDIEIADIISNENYAKIYVAKYTDIDNRVKYSADTNGDNDFTNEKPLTFKTIDDLDFADVDIQIIPQSDNLHKTYNLRYQIILSTSEGYTYARINEYRKGKLIIENKDFDLILRCFGRNDPYFKISDGMDFLIDKNQDGDFDYNWSVSEKGEIIASEKINLSNPFLINDQKFEAHNIDIEGSYLTIIPSNVDTAFSIGFYSPNFIATDINGNSIFLNDLKGKTVLLDFWSISCPPCERSRPKLNKIVLENDNEDFIALSIPIKGEKSEELSIFLKDHPYESTIAFFEKKYLDKYNPICIAPLYYLIDGNGIIKFIGSGSSIIEILEKVI